MEYFNTWFLNKKWEYHVKDESRHPVRRTPDVHYIIEVNCPRCGSYMDVRCSLRARKLLCHRCGIPKVKLGPLQWKFIDEVRAMGKKEAFNKYMTKIGRPERI